MDQRQCKRRRKNIPAWQCGFWSFVACPWVGLRWLYKWLISGIKLNANRSVLVPITYKHRLLAHMIRRRDCWIIDGKSQKRWTYDYVNLWCIGFASELQTFDSLSVTEDHPIVELGKFCYESNRVWEKRTYPCNDPRQTVLVNCMQPSNSEITIEWPCTVVALCVYWVSICVYWVSICVNWVSICMIVIDICVENITLIKTGDYMCDYMFIWHWWWAPSVN